MKQIAFLFVFLFCGLTQAQLHLGIVGGLNLANLTGPDVKNSDTRSGFSIGTYQEIKLSPFVSFQPELIFSQKGMIASGDGVFFPSRITCKFDYLELPLLLKFNLPLNEQANVHLLAGPSVAALVTSRYSTNGDASIPGEEIPDLMKDVDCGFILGGGIGYYTGAGVLNLEIRYEIGAMSAFRNSYGVDVKNSVLSILTAYSF